MNPSFGLESSSSVTTTEPKMVAKQEGIDLEGQEREKAVVAADADGASLKSVGAGELDGQVAINYRTCSWQKTAALLFSEYICLAIMSFPWSYSVLGLVPGLILTVFIASLVLYTSLTIWRFCLRHPEVRDVCDIGQYLFWNSKTVWYLTAVMFLWNNIFIQSLHCLVGAKYLNSMSDHPFCTIAFSFIVAAVSFCFSLPRTFSGLSELATISAVSTFVSVILATIFAGVEDHPYGYSVENGDPIVRAIPLPGTGFVAGMGAFLNIAFTFIGQITLPSFIAEMKEPEEFWKSVTAVTIAEVIVFSLVGSIIYAYTGDQYMTAPAFGSLGNDIFMKVSFSFMVPTLIFLGVLYASVSARFVFFRLFEGTRHIHSHTLLGWGSWAAILAGLWIFAWVIAEVIPFFTGLLAIIASVFGSFFGFIFWGVAHIRMLHADYGPTFYKKISPLRKVELAFNVFIIGIGLFFLGPGTYASVESVIQSYHAGAIGNPFSCADNGVRG